MRLTGRPAAVGLILADQGRVVIDLSARGLNPRYPPQSRGGLGGAAPGGGRVAKHATKMAGQVRLVREADLDSDLRQGPTRLQHDRTRPKQSAWIRCERRDSPKLFLKAAAK